MLRQNRQCACQYYSQEGFVGHQWSLSAHKYSFQIHLFHNFTSCKLFIVVCHARATYGILCSGLKHQYTLTRFSSWQVGANMYTLPLWPSPGSIVVRWVALRFYTFCPALHVLSRLAISVTLCIYNSVQARDDSVQQDIIHRVTTSPFSNTHTRATRSTTALRLEVI